VVWEKTGEKKQAATSVAARFLYMVVLYMVPKQKKQKAAGTAAFAAYFK